MACTLRKFPSFERHLKSVRKKYPRSASAIDDAINSLADNPEQGDVYPGFNPVEVRKTRIALKAYAMGVSKGLRHIFLYLPEKQLIVPLVIYKKGKPGSENEVKKLVLTALHEIQSELSG